ncbi:MAG: AI-2E family transporter [Actinobacteria bacterium]|nr:MAG: AI-2E family transporter [Actinomycetota bacterium]
MTTSRTSDENLRAEVRRADEELVAEPVSPRTVYRWGVAGALGVLTVFLAYRAVLLVTDILVQVLIAVFIAVSLDPAVRWLIQRRVRRGQAVAIILFAFVVVLGVFLLAFLPPLIRQGNRLVGDTSTACARTHRACAAWKTGSTCRRASRTSPARYRRSSATRPCRSASGSSARCCPPC